MSPDHLKALQSFAGRYGRNWRAKLSQLYADSKDDRQPDGHLLRQIRNSYEWHEIERALDAPTRKRFRARTPQGQRIADSVQRVVDQMDRGLGRMDPDGYGHDDLPASPDY